jgi:alpha-ribazole phosphatase/probable phosphoglycerate mutase
MKKEIGTISLYSKFMKIDFVRHGQTEHNKNGFITGQIDAPLSEEGVEQVKKILLEISNGYEELYSSDLVRCKQTVEILNQKLNLIIKYDSRLRERDFGSLAGKKFSEIDTTGQMKEKEKNQQYDYRLYGGESFQDVKKRVFDFIEDIKNSPKDKKILVVTSAGIIRLLQYTKNGKIHEIIHNNLVYEFEFS